MPASTIKILHLSTVHAPTDVRIGKQIRSLQSACFDVTLAAAGNETTVFPVDFPVIKLPVYRNKFQRLLVSPWNALWVTIPFKVIHFHDPELIPVGIILLIRRKKVIYDVHEDYAAQIADKEWIPKSLRYIAGKAVRFLEHLFHRLGGNVIAATPHISSLFRQNRKTIVRNVPDLANWPKPLSLHEKDIPVSFVGEIRPVRGAFVLQQIAKLLFEKAGIRLVVAGRLAGMSDQEKNAFISEPGIDYRGIVPYKEAIDLMRRTKIGLVPFQAAANNITGLPTKITEHFAAGSPVVMSDFPEWRRVFSPSSAAFFAPHNDLEKFSETILRVLQNPTLSEISESARHFIEQENNWKTEEKALFQIYLVGVN